MTTIALLLALAQPTLPSEARVPDPAVAEFLRTCDTKGSRIWGRPLCAPIVIVDRETGRFSAVEPAPGPLPPVRANTAFDWDGRRWIMVLGPLSEDRADTLDTIFHEAWHVHQQELGFPATSAVAGHLNQWQQRYFIRLEWNALAAALRSEGSERLEHVRQALAFRLRRFGSSPGAAEAEREQMRHEGLAAYTGVALSGAPVARALASIADAPRRAGLGRSFAYVSGPAWGLLLDALEPRWRRDLKSGADLPDLLRLRAAERPNPDQYGGTSLLLAEQLQGLARAEEVAVSVQATTMGRSLRLPLAQMEMDFDPDDVSMAPDGSTIYHRITLRDTWGSIETQGIGIRMQSDFKAAFAQWPLSKGALHLAPGWSLVVHEAGGADLVRTN